MEAEAIKDFKKKDMAGNNKRITEFFKPEKQTPRSQETSGKEEDADAGCYHTPGKSSETEKI